MQVLQNADGGRVGACNLRRILIVFIIVLGIVEEVEDGGCSLLLVLIIIASFNISALLLLTPLPMLLFDVEHISCSFSINNRASSIVDTIILVVLVCCCLLLRFDCNNNC